MKQRNSKILLIVLLFSFLLLGAGASIYVADRPTFQPHEEESSPSKSFTCEEAHEKAGSISVGGGFDPNKIVTHEGNKIVVNQLRLTFPDNTSCPIVNKIISSVDGYIVGFFPSPDTYLVELPVNSAVRLDQIRTILERDLRIKIIRYHTFFNPTL